MKNEPTPAPLRQLSAELAETKPMRRASLSERMVKCSKPGCRCREDPDGRHGPYFSLTRAVGGKTQSRLLTKEQAALARQPGVVEAGCKIVVGTRLKRAGMHWTVKGANAIIALRCCKLRGGFADFWESRSERMKKAA
jgi:hypothetical protein